MLQIVYNNSKQLVYSQIFIVFFKIKYKYIHIYHHKTILIAVTKAVVVQVLALRAECVEMRTHSMFQGLLVTFLV